MTNEPSIEDVEGKESIASAVRPPFWTAKRVVLAQVIVFNVLITIFEVAFQRYIIVTTALALINTLGWGVAMLAWCKADASERGYRLHRRFPLAIVLFGTATLIYYLFRTRGFVRGLAGVALFVAFVAVMMVVSLVFGAVVMIAMVLVLGPDAFAR